MAPLTPEQLLAKLGIAEWPEDEEDLVVIEQQALEALKTDNAAGYHHVRPSKGSKTNPFQAMAYISHGDQRHLGNFPKAEVAARQVLYFMCGLLGTPPTPGKKDRAKRGEGARKRDRRKSACRLSPPHPDPTLTHRTTPCSQLDPTFAPASSGPRRRRR
jgi:hypothetical protein